MKDGIQGSDNVKSQLHIGQTILPSPFCRIETWDKRNGSPGMQGGVSLFPTGETTVEKARKTVDFQPFKVG